MLWEISDRLLYPFLLQRDESFIYINRKRTLPLLAVIKFSLQLDFGGKKSNLAGKSPVLLIVKR